ncbi:hypothetical protein FLAVO9R_30270 [Flavobacterium sp. 9R]|nr:hypothetical protein FLAVO9R_30270 [Flavobacterium sp. 9R]
MTGYKKAGTDSPTRPFSGGARPKIFETVVFWRWFRKIIATFYT